MTDDDSLTPQGRAGRAMHLLLQANRPLRTAELMESLGYENYPAFWYMMQILINALPDGLKVERPRKGYWAIVKKDGCGGIE